MSKPITPPDYLLDRFPYLAPKGVTIPAGTPQIWTSGDGAGWTVLESGLDEDDSATSLPTYTRVDLSQRKPAPPRPELPTVQCSVIRNVRTKDGEEYPVAFRLDASGLPPWVVSGEHDYWLRDDEIVSFDYARIVPNGTGVLDEEDKSSVVDSEDDRWEWDAEREVWRSGGEYYRDTKAAINREFGPLRPADKGGQS